MILIAIMGCGTSQPSSGFDPEYDIYEGTVFLDDMDMTRNSINVHILKYFDHEPSAVEKSGRINLGSHSYGAGDVSNATVNGASVDYVDANGDNWF